jgi:four helix bundle protein
VRSNQKMRSIMEKQDLISSGTKRFHRSHKSLKVWSCAMDLVEAVYRCTRDFPQEEKFGLVSQMRRAAMSIPSNIAEGAARRGTRELAHALSIASGSASELETLIIAAQRLEILHDADQVLHLLDNVSYLLAASIRSCERRVNDHHHVPSCSRTASS